MISWRFFLVWGLCLATTVPTVVAAQGQAQKLSVTPPLYQLTIEPNQAWQSTLKVINSNPYALTIYAEVVDFASQGESGQGMFLPPSNDPEAPGQTLAEWITISTGPFTIAPEQSLEIPFMVELPKNAPPGGHFAAILVSTQPPETSGQTAVVTTQTVTSLFFVRVQGDIVESATIREFSTNRNFVDFPQVEFSLRIKNNGNVHIQPRGNILITNMWGAERGSIPINSQTQYGNVLPQSTRDFRYIWTGERSLADIGRYKAVATVAYGYEASQNISSISYFWVVPVKGAIITIVAIATFIMLVSWMIKLYVRRMLVLAGVGVAAPQRVITSSSQSNANAPKASLKVRSRQLLVPLESGVTDLSERLRNTAQIIDVVRTLAEFVWNYKRFFISIALLIGAFIGFVYYLGAVTSQEHEFEVRVREGDEERILIPMDDSETANPTGQE